jgi:hypothetical protein
MGWLAQVVSAAIASLQKAVQPVNAQRENTEEKSVV